MVPVPMGIARGDANRFSQEFTFAAVKLELFGLQCKRDDFFPRKPHSGRRECYSAALLERTPRGRITHQLDA